MNYIGSKRKLAPSIYNYISRVAPPGSTFCDLFAGTGAVSEKFANEYTLIVNDWETYSYYVNLQKFGSFTPDTSLLDKLDYLNSLEPLPGFISEHYSTYGSERMYFSEENAAIIDTIRFEIDEIADSEEERKYLIALLLEAADKVANVASVYGAYLKKLKTPASKRLIVKDLPKFCTDALVHQQDANTLKVSGDIVYLDPPYNTRHYGANYHMLNTIVDYTCFEPKGKTGLPEYKKSPYCSKVKITSAFEALIEQLNFSHVFISYNDEGILAKKDFERICSEYGDFETIVLNSEYQRFKADSNRTQSADVTVEYLYHLSKEPK